MRPCPSYNGISFRCRPGVFNLPSVLSDLLTSCLSLSFCSLLLSISFAISYYLFCPPPFSIYLSFVSIIMFYFIPSLPFISFSPVQFLLSFPFHFFFPLFLFLLFLCLIYFFLSNFLFHLLSNYTFLSYSFYFLSSYPINLLFLYIFFSSYPFPTSIFLFPLIQFFVLILIQLSFPPFFSFYFQFSFLLHYLSFHSIHSFYILFSYPIPFLFIFPFNFILSHPLPSISFPLIL